VTSEKASTTSIDDPDAIAATIREAAERNTKALREQPLPIAVEPPTVFRP
jgi:tetrahydromethanopterin S-methyltransferase subunit A